MSVSKPELLSKISVKSTCGDMKAAAQDKKFGQKLTIVGIASKVETGTTQYGEYQALKGTFKATRIEDGKVFNSGKCFLPDIALNLVAPAVEQNPNGVQFAFTLGIKEATNNVGYEYTVEPLLAAEENNPIALIEAKIN